MFKNKIFIIIVIIAIIAGGVGWYAYNRYQAALAAEKARQEEIAKKNAEAEAYNEARAAEEKRAAEEQALKDEMKADDQGRGPLEQQLAGKEVDTLPADAEAQIEAQNKKLEPEYEAIKAMLTAYNKVQNEYDYRTFTGHEGEEYMCPETAANYAKVNAPKAKEKITQDKVVSKFDGITIRTLVFTTEDFSKIVENPDNPAYAYAEVEVRSHTVEPAAKKYNGLVAVWMKKIDSQWKVYQETRIENN